MVRSDEYTLCSETYTNLQQTIVAAAGSSQIKQLIHAQYSSLKTVFLPLRKKASALNGGHSILYPNTRSFLQ